MKTIDAYKTVTLLCFFFGIFLGLASNENSVLLEISSGNSSDFGQDLSFLDYFIKIFFTNIMVGVLILCFLSFVTGGVLAILVLTYNGFILGVLLFNLSINQELNTSIKILSLIHAPTEIYALLLFSSYSFNGFYFYSDIIGKDKIKTIYFPKAKGLIVPTILIFISALIESTIIYFVIL